MADAAEPIVVKLVDALAKVLERMSPELISGVYNKTVVVGGTFNLKDLKNVSSKNWACQWRYPMIL